MDKCEQNLSKIQSSCCKEVKTNGLEMKKITEQEEDIICRMHKLVGDNWQLIAGRIPGRKADEIQRFWLKRNKQNH